KNVARKSGGRRNCAHRSALGAACLAISKFTADLEKLATDATINDHTCPRYAHGAGNSRPCRRHVREDLRCALAQQVCSHLLAERLGLRALPRMRGFDSPAPIG